MGEARLFDAHVHLDWLAEPARAAADAGRLGLRMLCCTVSPKGYQHTISQLNGFDDVRVAAGMHPWFVDGGTDAEKIASAIEGTDWVGEVGLDFGRAHVATKKDQLRVFEAVAEACSYGGKTISVHAVRSAGTCLDALDRTGALASCRCIFHWFSGTSEELVRAREAGCWFSVGERMLATRRGREYARQVPTDRLLLETDLPEHEGDATCAANIAASLDRAAQTLQALRPGWDPRSARLF